MASSAGSLVDYRQQAHFEELCAQLKSGRYDDRLDKPLAFWTVSNDRRLPLVFLGHTIGELIETPFEELCATPGVGKKKITTFLELLDRVVAAKPFLEPPEANNAPPRDLLPGQQGFNPDAVSETAWQRWREAVNRHGLGNECLGRFAGSLADLPKVIWRRQLDAYTELTLAQIRSLKTHGEKRVRAIIDIFGTLYSVLGQSRPVPRLGVRLWPRFAIHLEAWLDLARRRDTLPEADEVRARFVRPLLEQLRLDAGETVAELAAERIDVEGDGGSVRQAAEQRGLTRARVYQLLNEAAEAVQVRWPEGEASVHWLRERFLDAEPEDEAARLFLSAVDLFFPRRRGAGEPVAGEEE